MNIKRQCQEKPRRCLHSSGSSDSEKTCVSEQLAFIGHKENFWLWTDVSGFDLTHPALPKLEPVKPRYALKTANSPIMIAPKKTALLIIDMQNAWLSRPPHCPRGPVHDAEDVLLKYGIPAARKAGILIVWLSWGFSDGDLATISPTTARIFSFGIDGECELDKGIGHDMGKLVVEDGQTVQAGRFLMRGHWNAELHAPLERVRQEGRKVRPRDVQFHKTRISGICDEVPECTKYLKSKGYKTLLFAGVNTDVCVIATLQDANLKGFDTVLLKDGCGTTNGESAVIATERNCLKAWGFLSSCKDLMEGVTNGTL